VPEGAAETVLRRFAEVGLIDDATFAAVWVESRHYGRGLGRRALAAELVRRGVARDDIDAAVHSLSAETERATALALVERKLASTAGQPYPTRVKRLVGMLARKGYSPGLAYGVVKEALERAESETELAAGAGDDESLDAEFGMMDAFQPDDDLGGSDEDFSESPDLG
jgi:regulatory protein